MTLYEPRLYVVNPHWHVAFGHKCETLVYAPNEDEIAAWLKRFAITDPAIFGGVSPAKFRATFCTKTDCKPRPTAIGTLAEFLRHPLHGWWRRIDDPELV